MPAEMRPGYDHPHLRYEPMRRVSDVDRSFVVPVLLLETYEDPLPDWPQLASVGGGLDRAFPNISRVSTREYGHRVGIFRMLDALETHGFPPVVAIDAMTAEGYPWLVDHLADRGTEWVAHGVSVTRPLGNHLDPAAERAYIADTMQRLATAGIRTDGWFGPEYGESEHTPTILAELGLGYVMDWCSDEVPVEMTVPAGSLVAHPMNADLDDQTTLINRMATPGDYERSLVDAVHFLDGSPGRVLAMAMRPWIMGQPFRIGHFERFLAAVDASEGVAYATPRQILSVFD